MTPVPTSKPTTQKKTVDLPDVIFEQAHATSAEAVLFKLPPKSTQTHCTESIYSYYILLKSHSLFSFLDVPKYFQENKILEVSCARLFKKKVINL